MSNELIPFQNADFSIRIVRDDQGEPWFIVSDLCRALGLDNPTYVVSRLDDDEHGLVTVQGSPSQTNAVNESGLYSLILTSRKPEAKRFKKWVTSEVLPSIRKTGSYSLQPRSNLDLIELVVKTMRDQEQRLLRIEAKQDAADRGNDYFTILAYSRLVKLPITTNQASALGKMASAYCRQYNIPIGEANDPRYGSVHTYPENVLKMVFEKGR